MVPGAIPYRSIIEYARWHDVLDFDVFAAAIRAMDKVRLELARDASDPDRPQTSSRAMSPELFGAIFGGKAPAARQMQVERVAAADERRTQRQAAIEAGTFE
jgi:hypothetical protein